MGGDFSCSEPKVSPQVQPCAARSSLRGSKKIGRANRQEARVPRQLRELTAVGRVASARDDRAPPRESDSAPHRYAGLPQGLPPASNVTHKYPNLASSGGTPHHARPILRTGPSRNRFSVQGSVARSGCRGGSSAWKPPTLLPASAAMLATPYFVRRRRERRRSDATPVS